MTHDPMCPQPNCDFGEPDGHCYGWEDCHHACQCWLIERVRKDEQTRIYSSEAMEAVIRLAASKAYDGALQDALACFDKDDAYAAIKALSGDTQ